MICDDFRASLPEHLLGTLDGPDAVAVRRHLRGCGACRAELAKLEEGLDAFAAATHDRTPPEELRARVLGVLEEEWREPPVSSGHRRDRRTGMLMTAAAVLLLLFVAAAAWGGSQARHARIAQADAASYRNLLVTLGGKDFRVGQVRGSGATQLDGAVLLYEGDMNASWSSWGVLIVRGTGMSGTATATLLAPGGDAMRLPPLRFSPAGRAWVLFEVDGDVASYDQVTITTPDGELIGAGEIHDA